MKIIKLIRGFNKGMLIKVTDERKIGGIPWIGGQVIKEEIGMIEERGGQWIEGLDYITIVEVE